MRVIIFFAAFCCLSFSLRPDYLRLSISKKRIVFSGETQNEIMYKKRIKILEKGDYNFFLLDKKEIYINRDVSINNELLENYFADNIKLKPELSPHFHIFHLFFIIDHQGLILDYGFEGGVGRDIYLEDVLKVLENIDLKLQPMEIEGNPVSSLFLTRINLDSEVFRNN